MVLAATEAVIEGIGLSIRYLVAYFYADNGIVASNQPERLQWGLAFLSGLFNWEGFRNNTPKMVIMACHPYHTPVRVLVVAYERLTAGTGPTYREG